MTAFETPGKVLVRVGLDGGEARVETWAEPRVEVELVPLRDNDVTRQVIEEARVEILSRGAGHEVVVDARRRGGISLGRGPKVGVHVFAPAGADLHLEANSADLLARGTLGAVEVKSASGDVEVERAARLRVHTASGDVRAGEVGAVDVRTASGDAAVRLCTGALVANMVSGDLVVDDATAGIDVKIVSGDVTVRSVGGGTMRVQSVSGDVELAVKPGQQLYVDASSVSGTMSSELGLDDAPAAAPGAPVHELRVRTISGDLQILRGAAA